MHQMDCAAHTQSLFSCLGWGVNFTDSTAVRRRVESSGEVLELDDLLRNGHNAKASCEPPDLPLELAFLDVESCLPKLSTLESLGSE